MKSLKAESEAFLELSESLVCEDSPQHSGRDFSEILEEFNKATANLSFRNKSQLKSAAEYLRNETLRLSMTSSKHPHYPQVSSSQASAKILFAQEIAELIERN